MFAIYLVAGACCSRSIGGAIGVALGAACRSLIAWGFGAIIPLPIAPALHPGELALALVYGVLTAVAFALWPLGRAHDVPVSTLFRDEVAPQPALAAQVLHRGDRRGGGSAGGARGGARLRSAHRDHLRRQRPLRCSCCCG